jgi:hypothetical protein
MTAALVRQRRDGLLTVAADRPCCPHRRAGSPPGERHEHQRSPTASLAGWVLTSGIRAPDIRIMKRDARRLRMG